MGLRGGAIASSRYAAGLVRECGGERHRASPHVDRYGPGVPVRVEMYDKDRNGTLSRQESESTRVNGFEHLYDIGYFLRLEVDGAAKKPDRATEFEASVANGLLVYSFFVPLHLSISASWSTLGISVMDETFFVDFAISEAVIGSVPPSELETTAPRVEKQQTSSSGWNVMLQQVELKLRRKPA